jgi:hypothetical protein
VVQQPKLSWTAKKMSEQSAYGWPWFRKEIQDGVAFSERYCSDLLDLVQEMDAVSGVVFARPTSPLSDRPQDYVVSILTARALRLTVSALYIGLGGYPDSANNLERTAWEISIRLLDMTTAPVAAALGFLLDGAASEISQAQAELDHRRTNGEPVHLLPENISRLKVHSMRSSGLPATVGWTPIECGASTVGSTFEKYANGSASRKPTSSTTPSGRHMFCYDCNRCPHQHGAYPHDRNTHRAGRGRH